MRNNISLKILEGIEDDIRVLKPKEMAAVKKAGPDDLVIIMGQDHDWWVYSNAIDAYLCLNISTSNFTEDQVNEMIREPKFFSEDDLWNFGDIDV